MKIFSLIAIAGTLFSSQLILAADKCLLPKPGVGTFSIDKTNQTATVIQEVELKKNKDGTYVITKLHTSLDPKTDVIVLEKQISAHSRNRIKDAIEKTCPQFNVHPSSDLEKADNIKEGFLPARGLKGSLKSLPQ